MKSLACLALLAGCSSSPAAVAGNYTIAITNGANGCNVPGYTVGQQATGIPAVITQSGSAVTVTVNGPAGLDLGVKIGTNVFTGTITDDSINVEDQGTRAMNMGNCAFTYNAEIVASLSGDTLTGEVRYTAATNNNSDCATLQGCETVQDFNGTRPPP